MSTSRIAAATRVHGSRRRLTMALIACVAAPVGLIAVHSATVSAAVVAKVNLATAGNYSVLGSQSVTNTGPSILAKSLGVSPGTSITGFPPGIVLAPGVTDNNNPASALGRADLTAAYIDAAGRPLNGITPADLGGQVLQPGVYATSSKGALGLTGTLTLDGAGNKGSVFIFQTDSELVTASSSVVQLINGAQECNIFWQIGSSATLGTNSTFVGNILALTSVFVNTNVLVHGRALARNASVTLDDDVFTSPTCAPQTIPGAGSGSAQDTELLIASLLIATGVSAAFIARRRRIIL